MYHAYRRPEHEERLVGNTYSFDITVKPMDGTGAAALGRELQTIVLSSRRYVAAVSRQLMDLHRLEDLVGAVAVAVLPGEGHGRLAGGTAVHPLTGLAIPVVASSTVNGLVNPALGPSHCQLCRELGLPLVSAFNPDGGPIVLRK
jgi:hypothetical protein